MVQKVDIFTSLNDYLNTVTLEEALPGVTAFQEGLKIYHQWSTPEEIEKHGFLGIWIKIDSIRSEPGGKTRVRRRFLA
jgi:ASC-1-like (ASCH) protein